MSEKPRSEKSSKKRILVMLVSTQDKLLEEAVSAALVFASFEHHVQIALTEDSAFLLSASQHKTHKMLSSLALYDMPDLWVMMPIGDDTAESSQLSSPLNYQCRAFYDHSEFDIILRL